MSSGGNPLLGTEHTVLFVDDEVNILKALQRLLRTEDMQVLCASRPQEALETLERHPVQVVVSDQRMPEMSGVDLLSRVRKLNPDLVCMLLTGCTETDAAIDAIDRGELYRLMTKPWNDAELRATIRQAFDHADLKAEIGRLSRVTREQRLELRAMSRKLENGVRVRTPRLGDEHRELREAYLQTIAALANAVDAKDAYTRGHSERVGVYAAKLARELGHEKDLIERVYIAGLLHDVGLLGVRDAVITKPGRLTPEETAEVEQHPEIGAKILEAVDFLAGIAPCVRHHHEWFDGCDRGYPLGLQGEQITLPSRIILIADTVEAMTSDRPHREALPVHVVYSELTKYSGSQFDPACIEAMLRLLDREGERFVRRDQTFDIHAFLEA